jgi:putative Mn2+ efflux pump MntP
MVSEHWQAILIASASSTDNFLVGISVGLSAHRHGSMRGLVWGIAICNAATALATASFGEQIGAVFSPALQNCAAGMVFLWLAWNEARGETDRAEANNAVSQWTLLVQLAVPMSLNNMAGGVASGVAGVTASLAAIYALAVSVLFMESGVYLGRRWKTSGKHHHDQLQHRAMFWSCALYTLLGFQCFYSAMF